MKNYISTNKAIETLEKLQQRIDEKITDICEKMDAIEERAADADRDLTRAEQDRFDAYDEVVDDLRAEWDEVQNAIDYLMDYRF